METKKNIFHKKYVAFKLSKIVKNYSNLSKKIQNGSKGFKIFQNYSKYSNIVKKKLIILMVQYCLKYSKMVQSGCYGENSQKGLKKQTVQNGPRWSKMVQYGPNRTNIVQHGKQLF